MEIDLDRARRALIDLGAALSEARGVVQMGPGSVVRVKTESDVIELPVSWAVAGLVAVPYYVAHTWPILHPDAYDPFARDAVAIMEALPDGALAISDDPGLVWRAGRRTTADLVDASVLRIETGHITSESLAAAAAEPDVCAVVVTSGERWGSFDDLPDRLADEGYELATQHGNVDKVYVKTDCHPTP